MSLAARLAAFAQAVGTDIKDLKAKVIGPAGGDLTGSYPNPVVRQSSGDLDVNGLLKVRDGQINLGSDVHIWQQSTDKAAINKTLQLEQDLLVTGIMFGKGAVPLGGDAGKILAKKTGSNFDLEWVANSGGLALLAAAYNQGAYPAAITPGAATWQKFLIGTGAGEVIDPAGAFVRNVDGSITVVDAGWYSIQASTQANAVSCSCQISLGDTANVLGTYALDGDSASAASFARASTGCTVKLAAGAKIYANGWVSAAATSMTLTAFSIARVGGPKGDTGATGGNATVPIEPWHTVGDVGEPALQSGWGGTIKYRKDPLGRVWIKGNGAGVSGTTMFTLPVGYRPPDTYYYDMLNQSGAAGAYVGVLSTGEVQPTFAGGFYLDCSFDTGTVTQMPTGPQGPKGDTGGNATVPIDPWHTVGAVGEPAFNAADLWQNLDGVGPNQRALRFTKDPLGRVMLTGVVKGNNNTRVVSLPAGYRPARLNEIFIANASSGTAQVVISSNGDITATSLDGNVSVYVSFDGLIFDTESVTQMPTGPQGPKGDQGSNAPVPMDTWHILGAAGEPVFTAPLIHYDSNGPTPTGASGIFQLVGFRKDPMGRVYFKGLIGATGPVAAGTAIFTLPAGYWPKRLTVLDTSNIATSGCRVDVSAAGVVSIASSTSAIAAGSYITLDGLSIDTELVTQMPSGPQGPKGDSGGVNVLTTLDWDTAITSNFYRSYVPVDFMDFQKTVHGPGDTINPPPQAGIVAAHANGSVVQRVWDLSLNTEYTRYRSSGSAGVWSAWVPALVKPVVWADIMAGSGGSGTLDGTERYFQTAAMLAQGVMWKFRYHKVADIWHFVGGSDYLFSAAEISATAAAGSVNAALSFPAILPGSYDVEWGARMYQNPSGPASGNVLLYLDQMRGGSAISTVGMDIWTGQLSGQTWSTVIPGAKAARITGVANGDAIRLRSASTNYNGALESPYMRIRPVSVSM